MSDKPVFLVLQHVACEPPGAYEDLLAEYEAELVRVELDAGEELPADVGQFDGVIVMGGPMGVYETAEHPWLEGELELIRAAVEGSVPVWGVCLGAQLIAASFGCRVAPGPSPEIGVIEVTTTTTAATDPVFKHAPATFASLQWHSDTYELPPGATRLASSAQYPQQAFRLGAAYGLQFHIEVSADMLGEWAQLPAYASALERVHGPGAIDRLVADWEAAADAANALAGDLFEAWLREIVGLTADSGLMTDARASIG